MASTGATLLKISCPTRAHRVSCTAQASTRVPRSEHVILPGRRQSLFILTASTALTAVELTASAQDIPLFGLRKKLKKVEEEAEEILREGFETAEKGIETAEKGIETAERGIETAERGIVTAEKEIETVLSYGGLAQAGVVAGAEVVGVLIATSVVNGIIGPEGKKY